MTPDAFKTWRDRLGLTQEKAAERLGKTKRMIQLYESGDQEIPKTVRLACAAIALGLEDYDGGR